MTKLLIKLFIILGLVTSSYANLKNPKFKHEDNHLDIGLFVLTTQKFAGAKQFRVLPLPYIDYIYHSRFYISVYKGIGYNIIKLPHFTLGLGANYNFGQKQDRAKRFPGLSNVPSHFQYNVNAAVNWSVFNLYVNAFQGIKRKYGANVTMGQSTMIFISNKLFLTIGPSINWIDHQQSQVYYGISPNESQASGLPNYNAKAGFDSVSINLFANYRLSKSWNTGLISSVSRLLGHNSNSPILETKQRYFLGYFLTYNLLNNT